MPTKYRHTRVPGHPRATGKYEQVRDHVLVAERALGRYLPDGAVVHHINGDGLDNRPRNLVVCQDNAYHTLLHRRERALRACGHASWLRCAYCKEYDRPETMYISTGKDVIWYHPPCAKEYVQKRRRGAGVAQGQLVPG